MSFHGKPRYGHLQYQLLRLTAMNYINDEFMQIIISLLTLINYSSLQAPSRVAKPSDFWHWDSPGAVTKLVLT